MLSHPTHPDRALVTAGDVVDDTLAAGLAGHRDALRAVVDWAWSYLCRPHPDHPDLDRPAQASVPAHRGD